MAKIIAKRHKPIWYHRKAKGKVAHARKKTWLVKDRGKKGKTPTKEAWSKKLDIPKLHEIQGYEIKKSEKERFLALKKEINERGGGRKGARSTMRTLQMIKNINPSKKSDRIMQKDIDRIWTKK